MQPEDVLPRLRALGFDEAKARTLADHFLTAEAKGRTGHGLSRVPWLETEELHETSVPNGGRPNFLMTRFAASLILSVPADGVGQS